MYLGRTRIDWGFLLTLRLASFGPLCCVAFPFAHLRFSTVCSSCPSFCLKGSVLFNTYGWGLFSSLKNTSSTTLALEGSEVSPTDFGRGFV